MPFLQDLVHKLEVGGGMRYLRVGLAVLAVVLLVVGYNWRGFKNMATQEAMDAAQLARNIAQGKGYTTLFIRPFSMHLVKNRTLERQGPPEVGKVADLAQIKGMHPDLANPPVYPVVLAGLMKVLPFNYTISTTHAFWSKNGRFWRYPAGFCYRPVQSVLVRSRPSRWCFFWPGACLIPGWPGCRPACCWARSCSGGSACRGCPRCCC